MCATGLLSVLSLLGAAVGVSHPVYDYGVARMEPARHEAAVQRVMAMSEAEMLSLVPETPYARFCECPNCFGGVQGDNVLRWSVDRPAELTCRFCGTVVWPNPRYPDDQVMEGKNRLGETVRFRFYLHPQKQTRHFFAAHALMYRRAWLLNQCRLLGIAYQATGKEEYARRVALVLDKIATVYPHYPVIANGNGRHRDFLFARSQEAPYPWDGGRWGWHYPADEVPADVLTLFDLVCDSAAMQALSAERGYDVRARVVNDFFRPTVEAVRKAPRHISNYVAYLGNIAALGRVIGEPEWVHWAVRWIGANLEAGCFYDGCWHESPSYHYMTMAGIRSCFDRVRGYSDPPGYTPPADSARLENLDPEKAFPFYAKALRAYAPLDLPDGSSTPVHDTWAGQRAPGSRPRQQSVSALAPGFGHASLGRGAGEHQLLAQLHFSGDYGHHHRDSLNLTLFAKGREMFSDIGYTWTRLRGWTTSTLSHNTVVVDRQEQGGRQTDGDLLWFFPDTAGVAVVEADGRRAYSGIAGLDVYRRLLVMVPVSEEDAYLVDLFRVRGGTTHDWMLHGDASREMAAVCRPQPVVPVETMLAEGETWLEPQLSHQAMNPYGVLREMRAVRTDGPTEVTFTYTDDPRRGVRTHLLGSSGTEVFLGKSPTVRQAGRGASGDNRKVFDQWMPQLIVRRRGEAPLSSLFAAVHQPFAGTPFLSEVRPLPIEPADGAAALQVRHGNCVDTILSTLDMPPYPERTADGVRLRGRLGIVRRQQGRVSHAWLFEGESLSAGDFRLAPDRGFLSGSILAAMRKAAGAAEDAFLTDALLPEGDRLRGVWMVVTHGGGVRHAYCVERVEPREGGSVVVLTHDHGLTVDGETTREVFFPQRTFAGRNTFVIPLAAWAGAPR
ncbi:MAG: heparinase II/III family protein [Armatimonadota bacterium]|nr:heparinase II/III family protein [Armatimonadota bacterium]